MREPLDPRICNIAIDANALDRDGSGKDRLVDRFQALSDDDRFVVVVAGGVRDEVMNPRTPASVRKAVAEKVYNLRQEGGVDQELRRKVRAILRGNAQPGQHDADASHLCEAAEAGCGYFITEDQRILCKRTELAPILPPSLSVVTLAGFLAIFDYFEAGRRL
jgi:hypothetical protein